MPHLKFSNHLKDKDFLVIYWVLGGSYHLVNPMLQSGD
jgi:hypothetical protein